MDSIQQGFFVFHTEHKLLMIIKLVSIRCVFHISRVYLFIDFSSRMNTESLTSALAILSQDGRQFYVADVEEHFRPSDDLMRDHYRQCALACMKAVVGPVHLRRFDPDINLGPGGFN